MLEQRYRTPTVGIDSETPAPLCVDLDGTLLRSDILWESAIVLFKRNPLYFFVLAFWSLRGKAHLKRQVSLRTALRVELLPFHRPFVEYLRHQKTGGRHVFLATGADENAARQGRGPAQSVRRRGRQRRQKKFTANENWTRFGGS